MKQDINCIILDGKQFDSIIRTMHLALPGELLTSVRRNFEEKFKCSVTVNHYRIAGVYQREFTLAFDDEAALLMFILKYL